MQCITLYVSFKLKHICRTMVKKSRSISKHKIHYVSIHEYGDSSSISVIVFLEKMGFQAVLEYLKAI